MSNKSEDKNIKKLFEDVLDYKEKQQEDVKLYKPVPVREFINNKYYSGFEPGTVYDFWVDEIEDFIEGGYNEIIVTGSIGSGKTLAMNLLLMYKIYELFAHKNISKYLGFPAIQDIYNVYFSVSLTQAQRTGFRLFKEMIDSSQWFNNTFPRNKKINSAVEFPQNKFNIISGSNVAHAIGMTVWSFILDEGDFMGRSKSAEDAYNEAVNLYGQLVDRRISRFQKFGKDYSFSVLISSSAYQSSFVEKRIEEAATDPTIKVVKAVGYKVKPAGTYSKEKFVVFTGTKMIDPEIVDYPDQYNTILKKLKLNIDVNVDEDKTVMENYNNFPETFKKFFELVPIDFEKSYRKNLHRSLMNFSGIAIVAEGKLIRSKSLVTSNYDPKLEHPFSKQTIEVSSGDDVQLMEYFYPELITERDKPHSIHADLSYKGDSTGLSMVRYNGVMEDRTGNIMRSYTHIFSLEIKPPPAPYEIKISKIREFILYLYEKLDMNIVKVTFDMKFSRETIQILRDDYGLNSERKSLETSDEPFLTFTNLLIDNAFNMYRHETLEKEMFDAVHYKDKNKVNNPVNSSIDVFQSLVGAVDNLVNMDLGMSQNDVNDLLPSLKDKRTKTEKAKQEAGKLVKNSNSNAQFIDDPFDFQKKKKQEDLLNKIFGK